MSIGTGKGRGSAQSDLKIRLLLAVSVSALTTAAPSLGIYGYGGRARAQALDAGCTDQNGDSNADAGDTVTCIAPPDPIEDVITTVDDLTVVIGDGTTTTNITSNAAATTAGVSMTGGGDQRLEITSSGRVEGDANSNAVQMSTGSGSAVVVNYGAVYSSGARGLNVSVTAGGTDLTVVSDGSVEGGTYGIHARNYGSGYLSVSANDVTGNGLDGILAVAGPSASGLTVDVSGTVTGQAGGLTAANFGTGDTTITLDAGGSVIGQGGNGVSANSANGAVTLQGSSGAATGSLTGVNMATGGGDIIIQSLDTITGQGGDGAYLRSSGGDITISDVGTVLGTGGDGLDVDLQSGSGTISIQGVGLVGGVTGTAGDGIDANSVTGTVDIGGTVAIGDVTGTARGIYTRTTNGNITVNSTGTVSGGTGMGVFAWSTGSGDVDVDVAAASSNDAVGIAAYSAGGDVNVTSATTSGDIFGIATTTTGTGTITVEAGDAYANSGFGILATHVGSGDVSVSASGTVTSVSADGITTRHSGSGAQSVTADGTVNGGRYGIFASTSGGGGGGEIVINLGASASVTGQGGEGIRVTDVGGSTATVRGASGGGVTGSSRGVYVSTSNSDITVDGLDSITGQGGDGTNLRSNGGGITVSDVGTILGTGGDGIDVQSGAGTTSIQGVGLTGGVTGTGGSGIIASTASGTLDIGGTVAVGDVTGSRYGINAGSTSGDIAIASTGTVTGGSLNGILASSVGGDIYIDVATVRSTSWTGIDTGSSGGNVHVKAANVIADDAGIAAFAGGVGTLTIEAGDVSANSLYAIVATKTGSGNLSVSTSGTVTSLAGDAIQTRHLGSGGQSVIVNGTVTGANHGVRSYILGAGTGPIDIELGASASVTGQSAEGIFATSNGAASQTVTGASDASITGATRGIYLQSNGASALTVQDLASVRGNSGDGVQARSTGGTITISNVDTILGIGGSGIKAQSAGGDISIQGVGLVGGVAGTAYDGIAAAAAAGSVNIGGVTAIGGATGLDTGIQALGAGDITVTSTGVVEGGLLGIYALSYGGGGATTINVYNASGGLGDGIRVEAAPTAGDVSVTASGTANGGGSGVYVNNQGDGSTTIDVGTAIGSTIAGIATYTGSTTTDLSITATGNVTGDVYGVFAGNAGSGATTISTAAVTSNGLGILAYGAFGSTDLTITSTGTVTGTTGSGINAINAGTGALTVSTAGVSGGSYDGIYVNQSPGGTSTSVTATGPVTGNYSGVYVVHYGYGSATVSVGDVTGTTYAGIYAYSSGAGTGLTITSSGTASGGVDGIVGLHYGTGDVTVQANAVTATSNDAIAVTNAATGGTMTVTATGTVMGGDEGIDATAYGSGGLAIMATGSVTGGDRGVQAISYGSGSVTISLANVFGGTHGVEVYNAAVDATTISVSGTVTGAAGEGIYTATAGGANITVASGASVSGTGAAIETESTGGGGNAVADTVTLEAGASLSGDMLLHAGADTFNDASGAFTAALGGAGTDTVNFSGTGRTINGSGGATDAIREFEIFNFDAGGFTLAGAHQGLDAANFNTGTNNLTGTLAAAAVTVADGATLAAADAASITGNVVNAGTLAIGNSPGTVTVNGNFTQSATGDLPIEIDGTDFDQLIVTGDVTLGGNLGVSILGSTPTGTQTRRIIDGGGTLSGNFASVDSGLLISNTVTLDTGNADVLLTTTVNAASAVPSLTPNQVAAGDNLIGQLAGSNVNSGLVALANAIGVTADPEVLAARLYELGPEVTDLGLKFLAMAQNDFTRTMLDNAPGSGDGTGGLADAVDDDLPQGRHVWGTMSGQSVSQDGGRNYSDFDGRLFQLATGIAGVPIGGEGSPLSIGVAGGFSTASGETPNGLYDGSVLGDNTEAEMFHVGASLAAADMTLGGVAIEGATAVGFTKGRQDIEMNLADAVSGAAVRQTGDADFASVDWSARVTVEGAGGKDWPVQPFVELGATKTWQDGFSLSSTAASSLEVEEFEALRGSAGVGAAIAHRLSETTGIHAQVSGTRYFGDTQNVLDARFSAAPSASTFATAGKDVEWQARADAGIRHAFDNGLMFDAQVFGETGDLTAVGAGVTLSMRF